jgi:peptidyl-prolyl cis-trans isomerase A (cyclophilin A)
MVELTAPVIERIETPKKKSNKTIIFIIAIIVIILLIAGFAYYRITGNAIMSTKNPQILIVTSEGNITLELYPDKAPITVANFLGYVKDGTYENTVFHRVIKGFMIQGGGYTTAGQEKPTKAQIKLESNNGLKNDIGTIAMARTNVPDSATDQFFINTANNDFLNYAPGNSGYAVFGKVISGMDVVKKIEMSPTIVKNRMEDWPVNDIVIEKVSVL